MSKQNGKTEDTAGKAPCSLFAAARMPRLDGCERLRRADISYSLTAVLYAPRPAASFSACAAGRLRYGKAGSERVRQTAPR